MRYVAFAVSHFSFDTGWNDPFVNLMIRSHWIGSWSDPPGLLPVAREQELVRLVPAPERLHQRRPRRVLPGGVQELDKGLRRRHAVEVQPVGDPTTRVVLGHHLLVALHGRVIVPGRVRRILRVLHRVRPIGQVAAARALRERQERVGRRDRRRVDDSGRPPEGVRDRVRLDRELRRREDHEDRRAGRPKLGDLRAHVRGRHLVRLRGDDVRRLRPQPLLEAFQVLLAEVVVLIENRDLRVRTVVGDRLAVDPRLVVVRGLPAARPRVALCVGEHRRTGRVEDLRHLPGVEVGPDPLVHRGPERPDDGEHVVLLDELPRQLHRVRGVVAVVVVLEHDLAAIHAALAVRPLARVDVREVRLHRRCDRRIERRRPSQREGPPDGDRPGGDSCLRRGRRGARRCDAERSNERRGQEHDLPHAYSFGDDPMRASVTRRNTFANH